MQFGLELVTTSNWMEELRFFLNNERQWEELPRSKTPGRRYAPMLDVNKRFLTESLDEVADLRPTNSLITLQGREFIVDPEPGFQAQLRPQLRCEIRVVRSAQANLQFDLEAFTRQTLAQARVGHSLAIDVFGMLCLIPPSMRPQAQYDPYLAVLLPPFNTPPTAHTPLPATERECLPLFVYAADLWQEHVRTGFTGMQFT